MMLKRVGELLAILSIVLGMMLIGEHYSKIDARQAGYEKTWEETLPDDLKKVARVPEWMNHDQKLSQRKWIDEQKQQYAEQIAQYRADDTASKQKWTIIYSLGTLLGIGVGLLIRKAGR